MSSARAVSDTFQSNSRSLASRNARSAACLNSSNVLHSSSEPSPACSAVALPDEPLDVVARDARAGREDEQPLDRVSQLAHVARPVELRQPLDRLGRDRARRDAFAAASARRRSARRAAECPRAARAAAARGSARRSAGRTDPRGSGPSAISVSSVLVRRREHAHVDRDRLRSADARDDAVLQHAQHLGLRREAHVADLVEEERAAVGLLELARRGRRRRR